MIEAYIEMDQGQQVIFLEDLHPDAPVYRRRIDHITGAPMAFYEDRARSLIEWMKRRRT